MRMSQKRQVIATTEAPGAVGPYSQGIALDNLVFTAGQIPINPASGKVEAESIEDQTRQVLRNVDAVLRAAGSALHKVVKMTVFMTDLADFQAMNGVYAEFFPSEPPARSAFQVVALPLGVQIEMEAVALKD
jgi:2-iminobutanoate/2-iminopropanoate deaminase